MLRRAAWLLFPLLAACVTGSPRFGQEVATSFARSPMRKLTTAEVEIYYPKSAHEAAVKIAERMSECLVMLRAKMKTQRPRGRALIYLTDANFNNAYLGGQSDGDPLYAVAPLFATSETFHLTNLADSAIGDIGCHELLHYVHYEQVEGFWRVVNTVFGDVFPPQAYLESWFTEGLAQYYEGRLGHPVGRPNAPLYRAELASGLSARGGWIGAGDLSLYQRELVPMSGAYLTGMHFIEFLADKYGEDKLWELIDLQARSILSPFGVALRFKAVYGLTLGALIDQWSEQNQALAPVRIRPVEQQVLRPEVGYAARLASAPDGTLALITSGREEVTMLRLLEPDGRVRTEVKLARFSPGREWTSAGPRQMSGLSFTADSSWLYLMNDDNSMLGDSRAQLWKVDAKTGEVMKVWQDVGGMGGAINPAGDRYLFIDFTPGRSELVELDLATGARVPLTHFGVGTTVAAPAWSPDGTRLVFSLWSDRGFDLMLRDASGAIHPLTADGHFNYSARWIDDERIVFLRSKDGRAQAHQLDTTSGALTVITDAPFSAFDVTGLPGERIAFLDREGWNWSLDTAPLASREAIEREELEDVWNPGPPVAPPPPLSVESDEPYRSGEGLLIPIVRVPTGASFGLSCPDNQGCTLLHSYSFFVRGTDRLSFHTWSLASTVTFPSADFSVSGGYANQVLAPWALSSGVGYSTFGYTDDSGAAGRAHEVSAALSASRTVYTTPISFSLGGFNRWDTSGARSRFYGPSLAFDYFAGESTTYGGLKRALGLGGSAALYPVGLSSFTVLDVRAGMSAAIPLPLLLRHSLTFSLDGRMIEGAPDGALRVGGVARGYDLVAINERFGPQGPASPLPEHFAIAVRGYEDYSVRANRAMVAVARYRYPFIIDRGFASLLYVLPSLFFRQVDLEVFGSAALIDSITHAWLRALGASVTVRIASGGALGLSFYYRVAARLDEHLKPLHEIGFAFE